MLLYIDMHKYKLELKHMALLRIDKIVSSTGEYSRKEAALLIKRGEVTVNGFPAASGAAKADTEKDMVSVRGQLILYAEYRYIMMNKPDGVLSATEDSRDKTALQLLPEKCQKLKLFPAGRLDKESEGLLILTNNGEYAHRVISPNRHVFKKYYVETEGRLTEDDCESVKRGIALKDFTALPGKLEIISSGDISSGYVLIREGKFHQVRRMLGSLGKPVLYLKRISIGGLVLDERLAPGDFREMPESEAFSVFQGGEITL